MGFHVINLETSEPHSNEEGALIYATGKEAADAAKALRETLGGRYQPRPVPVDDAAWQARELARFADGTYTRLPWDDGLPEGRRYYWMRDEEAAIKCWFYEHMNDETRHHFAHVSTKVRGNIAFTENAAKGGQDIQLSMKPGRYLTQFYGHVLSAESIKAFANQFIAQHGDVVLKMTDDANEIERVYVNGPRSCMAHPASHFSSGIHPARVYAAGDLSLAFLETEEGDITARVLVWPARKVYGRLYGDDKLASLLCAQGYHVGELDGARLHKVEDGDGYTMPYIDGCCSVSDHGDHFRIGGGICAESQCGIIELVERVPCERCEDRVDADDTYYIEDVNETWCQCCADEYAFYCDYTQRRCAGEGVTMANGDTWSESAFERHGFTCEGTHENYPHDDAVTLEDGTVWCQDYFNENGFVCDGNGGYYANDDAHPMPNGETWSQEHFDKYGDDDETDETDDAAELLATRKHVARQGRDENPLQQELALVTGLVNSRRLTWAYTSEAYEARRWRERHGYPSWHEFELVERRPARQTVIVRRTSDGVTETWEANCFRFAGTLEMVTA